MLVKVVISLLIVAGFYGDGAFAAAEVDAKDASLIIYIELLAGDSVGHANGIFFRDGNEFYLITAGHVLVDSVGGFRIRSRLFLYSTSGEEADTSLNVFSITMQNLDSARDFRFWPDIDIAAIRMADSSSKPTLGVSILENANSPFMVMDEGNAENCDSVFELCWAQRWAYPSKRQPALPRAEDIVRTTGRVLAIRKNTPTIITAYPGEHGYSGAPIFAECGEDGFFGAKLFGIHTGSIDWDDLEGSGCVNRVSVAACADEVFRRIKMEW